MLLDAILKLHDKIQNMKLGADRRAEIEELEEARLRRLPLVQAAGPGLPGGQQTGIGPPRADHAERGPSEPEERS